MALWVVFATIGSFPCFLTLTTNFTGFSIPATWFVFLYHRYPYGSDNTFTVETAEEICGLLFHVE